MDLKTLLVVALGGAIGAVARVAIGQVFLTKFGSAFPYGTLFINVTGSLLIGVISELTVARGVGIPPLMRIFATAGVLGGYTTFSAFSLQAVDLYEDSSAALAFLYVGGSVVLGFFAAYAGQVLTRLALR